MPVVSSRATGQSLRTCSSVCLFPHNLQLLEKPSDLLHRARLELCGRVSVAAFRANFIDPLSLSLSFSLYSPSVGLRSQFKSLLESLGFTNQAVHSHFAAEDAMVRAVLTAGLYPNVVHLAKMMESGGMRGESQRKHVRNGFKTL